jgi:hypothetical protein
MHKYLLFAVGLVTCIIPSVALPISDESIPNGAIKSDYLPDYCFTFINRNIITSNATGNSGSTAMAGLGLSDKVKTASTSLVALAVALVTITYGLLMRYSGPLFGRVNIPSEVLKEHIETILNKLWVESFKELLKQRDCTALLANIDIHWSSNTGPL